MFVCFNILQHHYRSIEAHSRRKLLLTNLRECWWCYLVTGKKLNNSVIIKEHNRKDVLQLIWEQLPAQKYPVPIHIVSKRRLMLYHHNNMLQMRISRVLCSTEDVTFKRRQEGAFRTFYLDYLWGLSAFMFDCQCSLCLLFDWFY